MMTDLKIRNNVFWNNVVVFFFPSSFQQPHSPPHLCCNIIAVPLSLLANDFLPLTIIKNPRTFKMMNKSILLTFIALGVASAFTGQGLPSKFVSKSSLSVGPLQKLTNKGEYEKVVSGLMQTKGYTREQAEKEYNSYLNNPNDYALQKVSEDTV